jgi:ATP-dependent protease ClpP protease subunit
MKPNLNAYRSFLMEHGQFTQQQAELIIRAKAADAGESKITMEKSDDEAELLLYDSIGFGLFGGITAQDFVQQVKALGTPKRINLRINSPGGDVFDALAIRNFLASRQSEVVVTIDGLSASAATIVQTAGSTIRAVKGSMLMVHRAWGIAIGNMHDMLELGTLLEKIDTNIAGLYAKRSGRRAESFLKLMDAESWFTAEQAVEQGLVDKVIDGDVSAFNVADVVGHKPPPDGQQVEPSAKMPSRQTVSARLREIQLQGHATALASAPPVQG